MEYEKKILGAILASSDAYNKLATYGTFDDLSEQGRIIWNAVGEYYSVDPLADGVDPVIVADRLGEKHPKHKDLFSAILTSIEKVSVPNILVDAAAFREKSVKERLAAACASGSRDQIDKLIEEYNAVRAAESEATSSLAVYNNVGVKSLIEKNSSKNKIKILPKALNEVLRGGVLRKHHLVIFAPTDMGKSLFALNLVAGFLMQDLVVNYWGNEDPAESMLLRAAARVSGTSIFQVEKLEDKVQEFLDSRNWSNFYFFESDSGTPSEIEASIEETRPDVLIVDQIRNLNMGEKNFVRTLESAAQMMRRLGKKYDLVPISLTQASDSATGKNFLTRGDIDNSNVGIPGTADLMVGIGADAETEAEGYRWLSLVKNKVSATKDPLKVKFDPLRVRVD